MARVERGYGLNIWRGSRGIKLEDLRRQGIKRIINLESGMYDLIRTYTEVYFEDSMQFPADLGMSEYHMPCPALSSPSQRFVYKVLNLVCDGVPTYIHCKDGVDRTGFVWAVIRMQVCKWSYADALKEWKEEGRHPWFFYWEPALKEWSIT